MILILTACPNLFGFMSKLNLLAALESYAAVVKCQRLNRDEDKNLES